MKNHLYIFTRQFAVGAIATFAALAMALTGRAQNTVISAGVSAITPSIQQIETGPVLDVVPDVLADGYTINLTLIPSLIEFQGYQSPPSLGSFSSAGLNVVLLPTALPQFSVREVTTTVNVWDGQTVVLGGLIQDVVTETKDQVPVLGDVPIIGRLFQSQTKGDQKRNLMVFVTAVMVDPAGNRMHSEDELPFAQGNTPQQPPPVPGQIEAQPPPPGTQ